MSKPTPYELAMLASQFAKDGTSDHKALDRAMVLLKAAEERLKPIGPKSITLEEHEALTNDPFDKEDWTAEDITDEERKTLELSEAHKWVSICTQGLRIELPTDADFPMPLTTFADRYVSVKDKPGRRKKAKALLGFDGRIDQAPNIENLDQFVLLFGQFYKTKPLTWPEHRLILEGISHS